MCTHPMEVKKLKPAILMGKTLKFYLLFIFVMIITFVTWLQNNFIYKTDIAVRSLENKTATEEELIQGSDLKYILVWTLPTRDPIMHLEVGNRTFVKRNCRYINCHVTANKSLFDTVSKFDVIIFHGRDIIVNDLPKIRSPHQKYIFASMESAHYYPMCDNIFNGYFNWTWTYKLNSDEQYGYISIWDRSGAIIGPKQIMHWKRVEEMEPINDSLKKILNTKKHAAAWFVSNCHALSKRETVAGNLRNHLKKYNLTLDTYGACSKNKCPRLNSKECFRMLKADYYFYLSFENSFSEDYVTEKLLNALQYCAVPVVYGGANYTRFMPDTIYLDATKLSVPDLARKMAELINDKEKYYNYFRWHNHYSYHDVAESPESDAYCKLCSMMNDKNRFTKSSIYHNFIKWWHPRRRC